MLEQKCRLENIKGIYLIPDHHNPTTLTMTKEERHSIAEVIKNRNIITNFILNCFDIYGGIHNQFRWMLLPKRLSGNQFEKVAKENGVQVFCSERFAIGSNNVLPAARIAICSPKYEEELIKGLNVIKSIVK